MGSGLTRNNGNRNRNGNGNGIADIPTSQGFYEGDVFLNT